LIPLRLMVPDRGRCSSWGEVAGQSLWIFLQRHDQPRRGWDAALEGEWASNTLLVGAYALSVPVWLLPWILRARWSPLAIFSPQP